ncbi:MAG: L-2-hydroxyglutarate oxidase [Neptuniibacter caesariensis]|uniref:L-2-hydroxyglutarate oxidase n=1 Tax=Neptuniibacter caesariensis TaxID=207954 RepID=A0A2G6JLJ9_NEPCE|nr:MAG: L-2-hydroxyglutarate oxidase [Neptuniibacter caesariensis]
MFDFVVIGGGILGMSTAWQLQKQYPDKTVLVVEKEPSVARHQTGHNSGVIHAGVYYQPGSLKARFCKAGNQATKAFCHEHAIPIDECGKLLVATNPVELDRMQALIQRCADNGLEIEVLDQQQLQEREPNIAGIGAIFVPATGIVSFTQITEKMAELVQQGGAVIQFATRVERLEEFADRITLYTDQGRFHGRYLVSCAGLQSDRVVKMLGLEPEFQIIPFRGEYYRLAARHNQIVNHLIYPIPDPDLPFLGVHLTRMIDGTVTVGPNAVLAFKREGYRKTDVSLKDSYEMLAFPGMIKLLLRHFKVSLLELKNSISKAGYLRQVQKYCPGLTVDDMQTCPAGIRAQAVTVDGQLVDDFLFMVTKRALVVCNAPSPAATSAIPIGQHIVEKLEEMIDL